MICVYEKPFRCGIGILPMCRRAIILALHRSSFYERPPRETHGQDASATYSTRSKRSTDLLLTDIQGIES